MIGNQLRALDGELAHVVSLWRRIWRRLDRAQHVSLGATVLFMVAAGILGSLPPVLLGILVDRVGEQGASLVDAIPVLGLVAAAVVVRELLQVARRYLVEKTCTLVEQRERTALIRHLLRLDLGYFDTRLTGSIHGRTSRSIEGFVRLLKLGFMDCLPAVAAGVSAFAVVTIREPVLGAVMAGVGPVGMGIVLLQVTSQKGVRVKILRQKEEMDGASVELLRGLDNVRALDSTEYEVERVKSISERLRASELSHHSTMAWFDAAKYLNEGFFHIALLAAAIVMAGRGLITTGEILTYSLLFATIVTPLREMHRILDEAHESALQADDLFQLLEIPEDRSFKINATPVTAVSGTPAVRLDGVSVNFPASITSALDNVSIRVGDGEFVGICGLTGCGKSTLLKVLSGLVHPTTGTVHILGNSLTELPRAELALRIGYVSQRPFLISGTIRDNIAYGLEASDDEVEAAARQAHIHDEIVAMRAGYATVVGEAGSTVSGGQGQRLVLARMFLRRPRVLLLDEATASLDTRHEKAIQEAIEVLPDMTVVAVAHRLSTLRNADRILVMEAGRITEIGRYDELSEREGLFAQLLRGGSERSFPPMPTSTLSTVS